MQSHKAAYPLQVIQKHLKNLTHRPSLQHGCLHRGPNPSVLYTDTCSYATSSRKTEKTRGAVQSERKSSEKPIGDVSRKRINAVNIQMLSDSLHRQIFKDAPPKEIDQKTQKKVESHLKQFGLWEKMATDLEEVDLQMPELYGDNIDAHFRRLAEMQTAQLRQQAHRLATLKKVPPRPKKWKFEKGWTKYDPKTKRQIAVPFPDDDALVFDVEVLVAEGNYPTMAAAVSPTAWYSWCSERLLEKTTSWEHLGTKDEFKPEGVTLNDLIPLETELEEGPWEDGKHRERPQKLVVGHNVGFDRAFVKEQYFVDGLSTRMLDTMSMHIALSGQTSLQRILYMAHQSGSRRKEVLEHEEKQRQLKQIPLMDWMEQSSLNNLAAVHSHYYPEKPALPKTQRETFVKGDMEDVRKDFQELMHYCASDVAGTLAVFQAIWPKFIKRFPHPVTLAGMVEMGSTYLPVDMDWYRYINSANTKYSELQGELKLLLTQLAQEACQYLHLERYKDNIWLWDLDWTIKKMKPKIAKSKGQGKEQSLEEQLQDVLHHAESVRPARTPHLMGYPQWYRDLCPKEREIAEGHKPGPSKISTQMRVTPKLLQLVWDGFPLHYSDKHGWGFLVPKPPEEGWDLERELDRQEREMEEMDTKVEKKKSSKQVLDREFPIQSLMEVVRQTRPAWLATHFKESPSKVNSALGSVYYSTGEEEVAEKIAYFKELGYGKDKKKNGEKDPDFTEEKFPDFFPGVDFYKLPHKDGKGKRVGNPLSKDFLSKIEEGVLRSLKGDHSESVLSYSNVCSYWKNNMDRIKSSEHNSGFQGVILPKVVTAGTVTRRAVEATWMTASNAYPNRIGSELKGMIHSPPGYHFVGADVDSQELWIASVLGDAYFAGIHGCTALGWMVLQGNKKDGTDMHSMTASLVGISRDQAKVFNYGRIYGAGVKFAKSLLMQFNHRLTEQEAASKAKVMYAKTKGRKPRSFHDKLENYDEDQPEPTALWHGGSESPMFNQLEAIASSKTPCTPVLGCTISQALEPRNVYKNFMPSRINWVVQSSAVDYLHLMLVSMRWLLDTYGIRGRFSISIHDEVRYLVRSEDRYRAALALQLTNLLTRSMFAHHLGMHDLPQSVAFFSAVDLDTCLRKEVHMDCVTPSNPHGLHQGYNIPPGEALSIFDILEKTGGSLHAEEQTALTKDSNGKEEESATAVMS